ncbi:MAG: L-threonylcarbamoyladenylate synthase [bacterium]
MITNDVNIASQYVKNGEVIVFPTDTLYAIGGDVFNEDTFNKIYRIKERPSDKSLIILIENLNQLFKLVDNISITEEKLCNTFWPGALTIVFKANKNIPKYLVNDDNTVAIRMPNNKRTLELIKLANTPLLAPSANKSGIKPENSIYEIENNFKNDISLFLKSDQNILENEPSTIIRLINDQVNIIREGKIKKEDLLKVL